ncbi:hypothetical protein GGX14DRAFT_665350 [Mycena pura]|uniref:RING-14 protein n=1 Tax=Mycena pura TaxID=153505 RepID=A0AAD6V0F8_9AGAR|nr:hypothetical protein GGX14DRAFT_665350 [Mycena pura]
MHFSKTYEQLLSDLPPEVNQNAVQYRQLKKLINQVVAELASLGLAPSVLHQLFQAADADTDAASTGKGKGISARVAYELTSHSGLLQPRLHFYVDRVVDGSDSKFADTDGVSADSDSDSADLDSDSADPDSASQVPVLWALQRRAETAASHAYRADPASPVEMVIPLESDSAFFQLLSATLQALSEHLVSIRAQFVLTLAELTRAVSQSARPVSSSSGRGFLVYSPLRSDAGGVRVDAVSRKSDLYAWREIIQLYVQAEVFESVSERNRGERSVDDAEFRLKQFVERVGAHGLGDKRKLKLSQSRQALESFLELNLFILNVKKFEVANAEATRKILKKHTKRTALPATNAQNTHSLARLLPKDMSLPRVLVQELGTTLLPVIPSLEDYSCVICTSIAFKPVRLSCGHLFCVRCLVKLQKRGTTDCPMCRSPCLLLADRSNVDWALLNFMRDWFPKEASVKLKQNEHEAAQEQLKELGIDPDEKCIVM